MFLPFLVMAVWRWDRYGRPSEPGLARWIGPISLGVACAIKQTPWFAVPMLVTGVFLEARLRGCAPIRLCLRYLLTVLAVFAAVNLPFLAWHPGAWLHGTLIPLTGGLVADGQGLVTLATHGLTGGVNLKMLSLAGALAMVGARRCVRRVVPTAQADLALAPDGPLLLFAAQPVELPRRPLSSRSRRSTLCRRRAPRARPRIARRRETVLARPSVLVVAVSCVGVVIASFMAFSGPPLQLSVRSVITSHAGTELDAVTVSIVNRTPDRLVPHFLVNTATSQNYEGFWTPSERGSRSAGTSRLRDDHVVPACDGQPRPDAARGGWSRPTPSTLRG